jgi:hypothetical protein
MIKRTVSQLLALDEQERSSVDVREPLDLLRLPSLDERVYLYLRAVYGDRDFTSNEYSEARNLMLGAMAVDIAATSEISLPEEPWSPTPLPDTTHDVAPCASRVEYPQNHKSYNLRALDLFEDSDERPNWARKRSARHRPSHRARSIASQRQPRYESKYRVLPKVFLALRSRPLALLPAGRGVKSTAYILTATVGAGLLAFLLAVVPPTGWFGASSNGSRVALQSPQPDGSAAKVVFERVKELAPPMGSEQNSLEDTKAQMGSNGPAAVGYGPIAAAAPHLLAVAPPVVGSAPIASTAPPLLAVAPVAAMESVAKPPPTPGDSADKSKPGSNLRSVADIRRVQQRLIELGYLPAPADGVWGPHSVQALRAFRTRTGLSGEDQWDRSTEDALFRPGAARATAQIPAPSQPSPR